MKRFAVAVIVPLTIAVAAVIAVLALGGIALVSTHGISMQPRLVTGDLVVVRATDHYRVGDAAAYHSQQLNSVVLHRIVAIEDGRYVFQGDNNAWVDPEQPTRAELVGKEWLHIPGGGRWLDLATGPVPLAAVAFLLMFSGGAAVQIRRRRRRARRAAPPAVPRTLRSFGPMPPALRPIAAAIGVLAVAGVALGAIAWSRPVASRSSTGRAVPATVDFSYTATVRPSPAYDGTTVTDPQPIFRRVTDSVDVAFQYTGQPGTVTVDAELSTPGGWQSTVQLAGPVQFDERQYDGAVELNLRDIQKRANAAAAVTGLPAETVSIAVVPRVSTVKGATFAPQLMLVLDPLALRLGEEEQLTAEGMTPSTAPGVQPAQLSAFGLSVGVGTARTTANATVSLAALLAAALGLLLWRTAPTAEAERIGRKHGQLLLPVLPIALPAGRPIVDVPGIASLTKLAERYGLLVLHWTRSGVDTYVVQDEGTTYRYRTTAGSPTSHDDTVPVEASSVEDTELAPVSPA